MSRFMRILVMFDLPVTSKKDRKAATKFRKFLLEDGYHMVQFSVYSRVCNGYDAVEKHRGRIRAHIPDSGSIRFLCVTEKQYEHMDILLGRFSKEEQPLRYEQLTIF